MFQKNFSTETQFSQETYMSIYLSGYFLQKRKPRAIWISTKKWRYKSWKFANEPQSTLKIKFSRNNPLPGILLPGHPGGVSGYEQYFWTPADICDLGQQGDLYTLFWEHQGAENLNSLTWIQDLLNPHWFVQWKFQIYGMDSRSSSLCWFVPWKLQIYGIGSRSPPILAVLCHMDSKPNLLSLCRWQKFIWRLRVNFKIKAERNLNKHTENDKGKLTKVSIALWQQRFGNKASDPFPFY